MLTYYAPFLLFPYYCCYKKNHQKLSRNIPTCFRGIIAGPRRAKSTFTQQWAVRTGSVRSCFRFLVPALQSDHLQTPSL